MLNTMSNENFGFEELELWKKVREFKNDVRKISKAFPAYCVQARGSLTETINHLIDAFDEGYISAEQLKG